MLRVAVLLLIAATGSLWIAGTVAEAKGPPGKVTISGGNLRSQVVIARSDLVPIDSVGYWEDTGGVPYARTADIAGETPYLVTIYELVTGEDPQLFLSGNYFPANSNHLSVLAQNGALLRTQPAFGALLDAHIASTLAATMPNTGGPPASGRTNAWVYALLVAGSLLLIGSAAAVAYSRRS